MHAPERILEGWISLAFQTQRPGHAPPAFVEEDVMVPAEQDAVPQACLSAIGPMDDVVCLGKPAVASGEAAPAIARLKGAAEGGAHRAGGGAQADDIGRGRIPARRRPAVPVRPTINRPHLHQLFKHTHFSVTQTLSHNERHHRRVTAQTPGRFS
jgi:hypothetical protein